MTGHSIEGESQHAVNFDLPVRELHGRGAGGGIVERGPWEPTRLPEQSGQSQIARNLPASLFAIPGAACSPGAQASARAMHAGHIQLPAPPARGLSQGDVMAKDSEGGGEARTRGI